MPRCFITAIEITLQEAYVLDITAARHVLRDLRQRVLTLERLIDQLGCRDSVEVRERKSGGTYIRQDRRLVSGSVANALWLRLLQINRSSFYGRTGKRAAAQGPWRSPEIQKRSPSHCSKP